MATDGFVIAVSNKSKQAFTRMGNQLGALQVETFARTAETAAEWSKADFFELALSLISSI
jgi:uncharacterized protein YbaA (DUF1428 family)